MPSVLAAPDKFRGTASATQIAEAIAGAAHDAGWRCDPVPLSDGGEGLLECFGGANRETVVHGPHGDPVQAAWRCDGARAVIEMARASGRDLARDPPDPLTADTTGTGELIGAALDAGCREILVGVGGSATTDGGRGALAVLRARRGDLRTARLTVAYDVSTTFVDAAPVFAPQKGATPGQVAALTDRLDALAAHYLEDFGVDVRDLAGSGAAGGLAGGLAALGATLRPGFTVVAERLRLPDRVAAADLVVTGEGGFDASSLSGKVTGSLLDLGLETATRVVVIAGTVATGTRPAGAEIIDLSARFGADPAVQNVLGCVSAVVAEVLRDTPR